MRTSYQGEFDGLCGVYAIINAVRQLGVRDVDRTLYAGLFRTMLRHVPASQLFAVIDEGFDPELLVASARKAFRQIKRRHAINLRLSQPLINRVYDGPERFRCDLRDLVARPDTAVVVCVRLPSSCHWSVVQRMTSRSMTLRDSDGFDGLRLEDFDINGGRRHFRTADTLIVHRRSWLRTPAAVDLIENGDRIDVDRRDDPQELDHIEPASSRLIFRDI